MSDASNFITLNEIERWAEKICDALKKSQFKQVLKELEPYKDKLSGACSVNLYGYITNNINHIDYAEYE